LAADERGSTPIEQDLLLIGVYPCSSVANNVCVVCSSSSFHGIRSPETGSSRIAAHPALAHRFQRSSLAILIRQLQQPALLGFVDHFQSIQGGVVADRTECDGELALRIRLQAVNGNDYGPAASACFLEDIEAAAYRYTVA
jgi:hypothetical protein